MSSGCWHSPGWNRSQAARLLGIDRRTLFAKIERYGLVGPFAPARRPRPRRPRAWHGPGWRGNVQTDPTSPPGRPAPTRPRAAGPACSRGGSAWHRALLLLGRRMRAQAAKARLTGGRLDERRARGAFAKEAHVDALMLARVQFAVTAGFHFIFPPISIGLAWVGGHRRVVRLEEGTTAAMVQVGRLFGRLLAITFAVGVATGIVMEFQFGTNWAGYSQVRGRHLRRAAGGRGRVRLLPRVDLPGPLPVRAAAGSPSGCTGSRR